ncbi:ferritin-like domain-containing protein [Thermogladius sp. 4427co]|uniref:ferritin-like domain-containing protein n=1 Tax=Thermogladius sp. 4427co TaxID=3450718 RepID=UPI003F79BDBF
MEDIVELFEKYSELEKQYAEELKSLTARFKHPLLKALIEGIAEDSLKHSIMYKALATLYKGGLPLLTDQELEYIKIGVLKHIQMEAEMIEASKRLLEETDKPYAKLILSSILEDEKKHHTLLLDVYNKIAVKEKFGEEEYWDAVWKDSPWHGTPGG